MSENIARSCGRILLSINATNAQLTGLPVGGTGSWTVTCNIRQAFLTNYI
jgi:hypothetical protein